MNEREFIKTLENRAKEQEQVIKGMVLPRMFKSVSLWFGNHPWKLLIPFAVILTLIFHAILGKNYIDFILKIFGKL